MTSRPKADPFHPWNQKWCNLIQHHQFQKITARINDESWQWFHGNSYVLMHFHCSLILTCCHDNIYWYHYVYIYISAIHSCVLRWLITRTRTYEHIPSNKAKEFRSFSRPYRLGQIRHHNAPHISTAPMAKTQMVTVCIGPLSRKSWRAEFRDFEQP